MKIHRIPTLLIFIFLLAANQLWAQTTESKNEPNSKHKGKPVGIASILKDTAVREEIPEELPPPPPPQHLPPSIQMVAIDTSGGEWQQEDDVEAIVPKPQVDTSAVPEDELTIEIRKMLTSSNAINAGIEEARRQVNAIRGQDVLPDVIIDRMIAEFGAPWARQAFENLVIKVYRNYFTVEELKTLSKFYETDLGKKLLHVQPMIIRESAAAGEGLGYMLGEKVYTDLKKEGKIN